MDNEAKVQKYYDSGKTRRYIMYIEQFWALSVDPALDDNHKKRLAPCASTTVA